MTRILWNLARKTIWRKINIWSENNSAYMIVFSIKIFMLNKNFNIPQAFNHIVIILFAESKRKKKRRTSRTRKLKFSFVWCSWIFGLKYDGQYITMIKFTHESFASVQYLHSMPIASFSLRVFRAFELQGLYFAYWYMKLLTWLLNI